MAGTCPPIFQILGKISTSWPGLSRPSTSSATKKDVDARRKAGHDER
jgi:hypothetical protein